MSPNGISNKSQALSKQKLDGDDVFECVFSFDSKEEYFIIQQNFEHSSNKLYLLIYCLQ
jgi:hypothetical protein